MAGQVSVGGAMLANTTILRVAREGLGYNRVTGIPGDREYIFSQSQGKVSFIVPFGNSERVYVRYKTI